MKKILLCLLSIICFISVNTNVKALSATIDVSCPSTATSLEEITCTVYINAKDFKLKESLIEKINTIHNSNKELLANNYSTGINKVELDYVPEDLSISNFYNIIKNLDLYEDSKFI